MTHIPHTHHHKSNCQKPSPITPRFGTCMYDPYTSTHTIIRVTVKKRDPQIWHLYVIPIYQHSHHHKSNCQKASPVCTQIWHLSVCMTHIPALLPHKSNRKKAVPS